MSEDSLRFEENAARVVSLLHLYEDGFGHGKSGRRPTRASDILRSAVVLLHASLEEFLRGIVRVRLPAASGEALNRVPLKGTGPRADRYALGALVPFRSDNVGALIEASVSEYLDRSNWNNPGDIKQSLSELEIDVSTLDVNWDSLGRLMRRRHQIVHQADRNPQVGKGQHKAASIAPPAVHLRVDDVRTFVYEVSQKLSG